MHTEEQALKLWCPMVRVHLPVNAVANRVSDASLRISDARDREYFNQQKEDCNCIASKCAMWRWDGYKPVNGGANDEAHGHCGLAGKLGSAA